MPTTLDRLKELLSNVTNMSAVARLAGCNVRTLYRIRDGEMDPTTTLADSVAQAARKYQQRRVRS